MALYEPIRDAFNEFNKMLIDSQQWDEQHTMNKHNRDMQQMTIMNGLEQQQFNNQMATKEFALREAGDRRSAEAADFHRKDSNRKFAESKRQGDDSLLTSRQNRKAGALAIETTIRQNETRRRLRDTIMSEAEITPEDIVSEELTAVKGAMEGVDKQLSDINPDNSRSAKQRADLKVQKNKLKGAEKRAIARATPAAMMRAYAEKAEELYAAAAEFTADGMAAEALRAESIGARYDARVKNYEASVAKAAKQGRETPGRMTEDQANSRIQKAYTISGFQGALSNPAVLKKIESVQSLNTRLYNRFKRSVPEGEARKLALQKAMDLTSALEKRYTGQIAKIKNYTEKEAFGIIRKSYPKYKGSRKVAAMRKFLKAQEGEAFKEAFQMAAGDSSVTTYIPSQALLRVAQIGQ